MLTMNDLKKGTIFVLEDQPYVVLESSHSKMAQSRAVMQTKIKNLVTGSTLNRTFQQADRLEEAEIERKKFVFLFAHRGEYCFVNEKDKSKRFFMKEEEVGSSKDYLKPNSPVDLEFFGEKVIRVMIPVKMDLKVIEAPPSIKGDTATGGTKTVVLETGARIQAPLFVEMGDIIRVNTDLGTYAERVEKGK
ncbi:MAG: elongation factor P [Candidatus Spechtbacteria bacterium]|nr:elongation factor P [Candidatus Spechtbacteria bacterium]